MNDYLHRSHSISYVEDSVSDADERLLGNFWLQVEREYHNLSEGGSLSSAEHSLLAVRLAGREADVDPGRLASTLNLLLGATREEAGRLRKIQVTPPEVLIERSRPDNRSRTLFHFTRNVVTQGFARGAVSSAVHFATAVGGVWLADLIKAGVTGVSLWLALDRNPLLLRRVAAVLQVLAPLASTTGLLPAATEDLLGDWLRERMPEVAVSARQLYISLQGGLAGYLPTPWLLLIFYAALYRHSIQNRQIPLPEGWGRLLSSLPSYAAFIRTWGDWFVWATTARNTASNEAEIITSVVGEGSASGMVARSVFTNMTNGEADYREYYASPEGVNVTHERFNESAMSARRRQESILPTSPTALPHQARHGGTGSGDYPYSPYVLRREVTPVKVPKEVPLSRFAAQTFAELQKTGRSYRGIHVEMVAAGENTWLARFYLFSPLTEHAQIWDEQLTKDQKVRLQELLGRPEQLCKVLSTDGRDAVEIPGVQEMKRNLATAEYGISSASSDDHRSYGVKVLISSMCGIGVLTGMGVGAGITAGTGILAGTAWVVSTFLRGNSQATRADAVVRRNEFDYGAAESHKPRARLAVALLREIDEYLEAGESQREALVEGILNDTNVLVSLLDAKQSDGVAPQESSGRRKTRSVFDIESHLRTLRDLTKQVAMGAETEAPLAQVKKAMVAEEKKIIALRRNNENIDTSKDNTQNPAKHSDIATDLSWRYHIHGPDDLKNYQEPKITLGEWIPVGVINKSAGTFPDGHRIKLWFTYAPDGEVGKKIETYIDIPLHKRGNAVWQHHFSWEIYKLYGEYLQVGERVLPSWYEPSVPVVPVKSSYLNLIYSKKGCVRDLNWLIEHAVKNKSTEVSSQISAEVTYLNNSLDKEIKYLIKENGGREETPEGFNTELLYIKINSKLGAASNNNEVLIRRAKRALREKIHSNDFEDKEVMFSYLYSRFLFSTAFEKYASDGSSEQFVKKLLTSDLIYSFIDAGGDVKYDVTTLIDYLSRTVPGNDSEIALRRDVNILWPTFIPEDLRAELELTEKENFLKYAENYKTSKSYFLANKLLSSTVNVDQIIDNIIAIEKKNYNAGAYSADSTITYLYRIISAQDRDYQHPTHVRKTFSLKEIILGVKRRWEANNPYVVEEISTPVANEEFLSSIEMVDLEADGLGEFNNFYDSYHKDIIIPYINNIQKKAGVKNNIVFKMPIGHLSRNGQTTVGEYDPQSKLAVNWGVPDSPALLIQKTSEEIKLLSLLDSNIFKFSSDDALINEIRGSNEFRTWIKKHFSADVNDAQISRAFLSRNEDDKPEDLTAEQQYSAIVEWYFEELKKQIISPSEGYTLRLMERAKKYSLAISLVTLPLGALPSAMVSMLYAIIPGIVQQMTSDLKADQDRYLKEAIVSATIDGAMSSGWAIAPTVLGKILVKNIGGVKKTYNHFKEVTKSMLKVFKKPLPLGSVAGKGIFKGKQKDFIKTLNTSASKMLAAAPVLSADSTESLLPIFRQLLGNKKVDARLSAYYAKNPKADEKLLLKLKKDFETLGENYVYLSELKDPNSLPALKKTSLSLTKRKDDLLAGIFESSEKLKRKYILDDMPKVDIIRELKSKPEFKEINKIFYQYVSGDKRNVSLSSYSTIRSLASELNVKKVKASNDGNGLISNDVSEKLLKDFLGGLKNPPINSDPVKSTLQFAAMLKMNVYGEGNELLSRVVYAINMLRSEKFHGSNFSTIESYIIKNIKHNEIEKLYHPSLTQVAYSGELLQDINRFNSRDSEMISYLRTPKENCHNAAFRMSQIIKNKDVKTSLSDYPKLTDLKKKVISGEAKVSFLAMRFWDRATDLRANTHYVVKVNYGGSIVIIDPTIHQFKIMGIDGPVVLPEKEWFNIFTSSKKMKKKLIKVDEYDDITTAISRNSAMSDEGPVATGEFSSMLMNIPAWYDTDWLNLIELKEKISILFFEKYRNNLPD